MPSKQNSLEVASGLAGPPCWVCHA